jgi:hypothetical protein
VLIEGATGRPCGPAYLLRDRPAIFERLSKLTTSGSGASVRRAARHSGMTAGQWQKRHRMAAPGVPDTQQQSNAFSLGQSPEALSRDG